MAPCIIGCGAMGSLLALQLYRATGEPPVCIARDPGRARELASLEVEEGGALRHVPVEAYSGPVPGLCRTAIVAVKSWSLPGALRAARLSGAEKVFLLLNGLVGEAEAARYGYRPRFIVSTYGARRTGRARVVIAGEGYHVIGLPGALDEESCRLAGLLRMGGAKAWCTGRIEWYRWLKAGVNAAINGVTSVLWAPNRVVVENPWARRVALRVAWEAAEAARRAGVELRGEEVVGEVLRVARDTGDNVSSTLQDLEACRRTEAPAIYEPIIRALEGRAPTIEALYFLVRALELGGLRCRGRRSQHPAWQR
ncbi:MAG: hypothetical protein F7C34_03945 [Desulfurococcales archaeon]|nr:hypothetical protein [Desulfurococcales archaeon]